MNIIDLDDIIVLNKINDKNMLVQDLIIYLNKKIANNEEFDFKEISEKISFYFNKKEDLLFIKLIIIWLCYLNYLLPQHNKIVVNQDFLNLIIDNQYILNLFKVNYLFFNLIKSDQNINLDKIIGHEIIDLRHCFASFLEIYFRFAINKHETSKYDNTIYSI